MARALWGSVAVVALAGAATLLVRLGSTGSPTVDEIGAATAAESPWLDEDWELFSAKVRWAVDRGLDTVPLPRAIADIGRSFVGTAYVPKTLEAPGPEHLVIDFRGLDCVTFVENAFSLARFVQSGGAALLVDRPAAEARYSALLTELRYRDGKIDGYPSRLHYFSDWIADNASRGLVRDLTRDLGGVLDDERLDFMSTHEDAYRQLSDPANVAAVRDAEGRLTQEGRWFIPEDRIAAVSDQIHDGDVIAATSTVAGLDVAHTGLALWVDGTLRLLHAPLVGDSVQISEVPLAERIQGIAGQDGIMVARPAR
jgi:N-acetylmuramoyl-L-alanine amidase-like